MPSCPTKSGGLLCQQAATYNYRLFAIYYRQSAFSYWPTYFLAVVLL
jgi:hypothetical protein